MIKINNHDLTEAEKMMFLIYCPTLHFEIQKQILIKTMNSI